jgi:uncharacterized protein (TIGR03435 family)
MSIRTKWHLVAIAILSCCAIAQTNAAPLKPMDRDAHPSFAVATIKPHDPASQHQGYNMEGSHYTIRNQTIASLLVFAYAIHPRQIADAPDAALHDRWDVEGTLDTPGDPRLRQQQEIVQKLLVDRFGLRFHREKRELPVYAIVLKGKLKLKPPADPDAEVDQEGNGHGTEQTIVYTNAAVADFILGEQFFTDRPLVDRTGLTGRYDFSFRYTWDEAHATDPNAPPGLFTAVQEQLGLKFQPTKAPVDAFIIDRVEPPSAN